jgi:hypothetical protein
MAVAIIKKETERRSRKILPTIRIALPKQLDLLRAWAAASGPGRKAVQLSDAAEIVKMAVNTITLANAFFCDVGLLQRQDGGFVPSEDVVSFSRSYEWNPETAPQKLAPLFEASWFAQALMPKLSFGTLQEDEAIQTLAEAADAPPEYGDQLGVLLEYMEKAGLIQRDGDTVRKGTVAGLIGSERPSTPAHSSEGARETPSRAVVATAFTAPTEGVVQFHVTVKVDMKEFASWQSDRIASFFAGIAQVLAAKGKIENDASS